MRSILVPTDFSDCSAAAYSYASMLAERTSATIYLLHILDVSAPSLALGAEEETTQDTPFMIKLMKVVGSRMQKIKNGKEFKNVEVQEIIELGSIPDKIIKAVKKYKADMIVMGTHGANGLQEKFIGSTAEKVVRNAEVPVLSVKHTLKKPKIEKIFFATDFSAEAEYAFPAVSNIALLFKAKLIVTKVITPGRFETSVETDRQIKKFKAKVGFNNYSTSVYYADSKEDGIRYGAEVAGADMIALGTHGRHGLAHFFRGSVAEDVVSHASLPVLTVNFPKKKMNLKETIRERNNNKYESDLLYQIPAV